MAALTPAKPIPEPQPVTQTDDGLPLGYGPSAPGQLGPPAGYPPHVPGEVNVIMEGEDEPWDIEDPGPVPDTAFYIYQDDTSAEYPHAGQQTFGTMNKTGVYRPIHDAMPDRMEDYLHIGQDNPAREAWLTQRGHEIPTGLTWRIEIEQMATVDGDLRLRTQALLGKDNVHDSADHALFELWSISGETPAVLFRTDDYFSCMEALEVPEQ